MSKVCINGVWREEKINFNKLKILEGFTQIQFCISTINKGSLTIGFPFPKMITFNGTNHNHEVYFIENETSDIVYHGIVKVTQTSGNPPQISLSHLDGFTAPPSPFKFIDNTLQAAEARSYNVFFTILFIRGITSVYNFDILSILSSIGSCLKYSLFVK